jgi:hypothetical protein
VLCVLDNLVDPYREARSSERTFDDAQLPALCLDGSACDGQA